MSRAYRAILTAPALSDLTLQRESLSKSLISVGLMALLEQFNAYVEECKGLGYTIEAGSFEGFYSADNTEGHNVYLYYDEKDYSMSGTISAPETKSE